jgi:hypothetical protein
MKTIAAGVGQVIELIRAFTRLDYEFTRPFRQTEKTRRIASPRFA